MSVAIRTRVGTVWWVNVARIMTIAVFAAVLPALPAVPAQTGRDPHNWALYTNVRFRYAICYPSDLFTGAGESADGDGQAFVARDGARLLVYGANNALDQPLADVLARTAARLSGAQGTVTYKVLKSDWFVVSGTDGATVFYAKTLYSNDQFKTFELRYQRSHKDTYDPLITHIVACFSDLTG